MPPVARRAAVFEGVRAIFPFTVIAGPFGLIYGVTASEAGASAFDAIIASFLIMGGAAQIALMELVGDEASWVVAALTPIVINLRFALYSASVATAFSDFPARLRYPLAHGLTDQATIVAVRRFETESDPGYRLWFFSGAAIIAATSLLLGDTGGLRGLDEWHAAAAAAGLVAWRTKSVTWCLLTGMGIVWAVGV